MKKTKIKHLLMKQVFSWEALWGLGWGVKRLLKSLDNLKMTDPTKGQFNGHYRRLIKINNYPYEYQAINSQPVRLCFAKRRKRYLWIFVWEVFCFGFFQQQQYVPWRLILGLLFPGHRFIFVLISILQPSFLSFHHEYRYQNKDMQLFHKQEGRKAVCTYIPDGSITTSVLCL